MTPLETARNKRKDGSCIHCANCVEIKGIYYCEISGKILLPSIVNIGYCIHKTNDYKAKEVEE